MSDSYFENTEFTAGKMKALLSAQITYTRGLHEMQRAYLDLVHRALELTQRVTRDLTRCTSVSEVGELQRTLLRDGMDQMFEGSAKIFRVSSQATDEVVRSIESQIGQAS